MRWCGVVVLAGFLALLLACVPDDSTALQLTLMARSDRNSYSGVRCENEGGDLVSGATLVLNATTPPDCFSEIILSSGERMFNFTTSCEGFLQCKNGDECSNSRKLEAYPVPPPATAIIEMAALAGQKEPVVLESNVEGSNTGQVSVMWAFVATSTVSEVMMSPNGVENSLILRNLTTTDTGVYYPVATATSPSLTNVNWMTVTGQQHSLQVDNFALPHFTKNLTCEEEPGQMWRCTIQATGTDTKFEWFIDNERVDVSDSRVFSLMRSTIVLHNLQSSDMQLTVQVYNMNRQQTYRVTQSAAILVPSNPCPTTHCPTTHCPTTPCPTTLPVQENETCLLPWVPIVGVLAVLLLVTFFSLIVSLLCLCYRCYHSSKVPLQTQLSKSSEVQLLTQTSQLSSQSSQPQPDDATSGMEYTLNGTKISLTEAKLKEYNCVMDCLLFVTSSLTSSSIVQKNEELYKALQEIDGECNKRRRRSVECDSKGESSDIETPKYSELKEALDKLLVAWAE